MKNISESTISKKMYMCGIDKEWIVFLHGIGGNHSIFYKQIDTFKEDFNLLLIDLPGHGNSQNLENGIDTLYSTSKMVVDLLDKLNIHSAHFIGVSLGTIVMQYISIHYPNRIKSMTLAGSVGRWLKWGELLGRLTLSFMLRKTLPYMIPYVIFAYILMPKKNHKKSRDIFIREAHKLGKDSYLRWSFVLRDSNKIYNTLSQKVNEIPKLYISGEEDHMFLKGIKSHVDDEASSELYIIKECGHVCNIEKPLEFNQVSLNFIKEVSGNNSIMYNTSN